MLFDLQSEQRCPQASLQARPHRRCAPTFRSFEAAWSGEQCECPAGRAEEGEYGREGDASFVGGQEEGGGRVGSGGSGAEGEEDHFRLGHCVGIGGAAIQDPCRTTGLDRVPASALPSFLNPLGRDLAFRTSRKLSVLCPVGEHLPCRRLADFE